MSKVKGPFTYEAPKPEDIKFTPLNQKKEMNGKELMEFYEVHLKSLGVDNRMTNILANIYILFAMLLDILSFMIPVTMFSSLFVSLVTFHFLFLFSFISISLSLSLSLFII